MLEPKILQIGLNSFDKCVILNIAPNLMKDQSFCSRRPYLDVDIFILVSPIFPESCCLLLKLYFNATYN